MEPNQQPVLRVERVSKRYGQTLALDEVSLSGSAGEVHAVLGENGAGKTTLMRILAGKSRPTSGRVLLHGKPIEAGADEPQVAMAFQRPVLVETLTIAENLSLARGGRSTTAPPVPARAPDLGFLVPCPFDTLVGDLPLGDRQLVDVYRAVSGWPSLLILDEPTAHLAPRQCDALYDFTKQLAAHGMAVIFVTHKLTEVLEHADRATILRRGGLEGTLERAEFDREHITRMLLGTPTFPVFERSTRKPGAARNILEFQKVSTDPKVCPPGLRALDLAVCAGEVHGIAGIAGNGQREIFHVLAGALAISDGSCLIDGKPYSFPGGRQLIAFIPEDSHGDGVASKLTVAQNLVLGRLRGRGFANGWAFVDRAAVGAAASRLIDEYDIACSGLSAKASSLSGGNLRKLIIARELDGEPPLIIAENPTAGLDVRAAARVRELLSQSARKGAGVLLISSDLDELIQVADRVSVLLRGRFVARHARPLSQLVIGDAMLGLDAGAQEGTVPC